MKLTNKDLVTGVEWACIGSTAATIAGVFASKWIEGVGLTGPVLGFLLGALVGTIAGIIYSVGITLPPRTPPISLGGGKR
jgi:hypothetical protein